MTVAGFSGGATLAAWLTLTQLTFVRGVIAVAPYIHPLEEWQPHIRESAKRGLHHAMFIGQRDTFCYDSVIGFYDEMIRHDIRADMKIYRELEHAFPADWSEVLAEALTHYP